MAAELPADFAGERILLAGDDVTEAIRAEEVGVGASKVAAMPAVRTALLERQRAYRRLPGLVADGRDMGSVVFPEAAGQGVPDRLAPKRAPNDAINS